MFAINQDNVNNAHKDGQTQLRPISRVCVANVHIVNIIVGKMHPIVHGCAGTSATYTTYSTAKEQYNIDRIRANVHHVN